MSQPSSTLWRVVAGETREMKERNCSPDRWRSVCQQVPLRAGPAAELGLGSLWGQQAPITPACLAVSCQREGSGGLMSFAACPASFSAPVRLQKGLRDRGLEYRNGYAVCLGKFTQT